MRGEPSFLKLSASCAIAALAFVLASRDYMTGIGIAAAAFTSGCLLGMDHREFYRRKRLKRSRVDRKGLAEH
jgi:hypothetical protein